jgi:hypothetical protein
VGEKPALSRERLCKHAGIKRRTHLLWTRNDELLPNKESWGELDLIRAAQLGVVWSALGPSAARIAWQDVRGDLPVSGEFVELIYALDAERATIATSAEELARLLPRGSTTIVVDLAAPMRTAKERYAEVKKRSGGRSEVAARPQAARLPDREKAS